MKWHQQREGFKGQRIVVVPRPVLEKVLKDPLLRNLVPTDAGYYPKAKGHTCAREHGAPEAANGLMALITLATMRWSGAWLPQGHA